MGISQAVTKHFTARYEQKNVLTNVIGLKEELTIVKFAIS